MFIEQNWIRVLKESEAHLCTGTLMKLRSTFLIFALGASQVCLAGAAEVLPANGLFAKLEHETGRYTDRTTLILLLGKAGAQSHAGVLDPNHEFEFDVFVPKNYDPLSPAGLLVYVSPVDSGAIPDTWKEIFDRRNLIWVSVNNSGNSMPPGRRVAEAKVSRAFILQNYEIDPRRIYVSGMSGGGQISGIVASDYPKLFRGGIFLCGVNPWSERDAGR